MSVKLYVEGGGDSKALRRACAKGFRTFIERAGLEGRLPRIVACGGRNKTFDRFSTTHNAGEDTPVLLVDAEGPVTAAPFPKDRATINSTRATSPGRSMNRSSRPAALSIGT